ncbi:hypothetical protein [Streptomyces sp. SP2-10]|uniref:hypothetical protein n=1 Tax=Streptomyces sp. SP2-10 TaxID=2873385 RepID=UPI001CA6AB26|nr:hypothetical protein [Streptomyces sp. SP2-10]MBY8845636.1 hypothetical protein [Streptomyces sp. SP2-10]
MVEKSRRSRTLASWETWKVLLLFFVALAVFCGAGWAFLNKGLYLLPDEMCDGTLAQGTVKQVLPNAQSAGSDSDRQGKGDRLRVWCKVTTSNDSLLSGRARVEPVSRRDWLAGYRESGQQQVVQISVGEIGALAQLDPDTGASSVYVPCTPPEVPSYNASQPYAVVGEAWVHGPAKAKGAPLRQALTDFAYQLTRHAYDLAECKESRDLPEKLPRYGDHR